LDVCILPTKETEWFLMCVPSLM